VQVRVGARLEGDPFTVLIAAGSKNADLTDSKESPRQAPAVTARVRSGRR
jgi:hypothetical protein